MIKVTSTPNNLGARVSGDMGDFLKLYDALHAIVGEEGEYKRHGCACIRTLGFCYDLRHALQGDREFEFAENRMDENRPLPGGMIAPKMNLRMAFDTLWPEMIFVMMAINDLVTLYAGKLTKEKIMFMNDKALIWNRQIAAARDFQAEVVECLRNMVSKQGFSKIMNAAVRGYGTQLDDYIRQYLDLLNARFAAMGKEERLKKLPHIAKLMATTGVDNRDYNDVKRSVLKAAEENGCYHGDLNLQGTDIDDDIPW